MADRSQFLRGILEGCILKIIETDETYGYEITEKLKHYGFQNISEGTIYPLLLRLEKNVLIDSVKKDSVYGPKRKYYHLTREGEEELKSFYNMWQEIKGSMDELFDNKGGEDCV